jgi:hypothetical protein
MRSGFGQAQEQALVRPAPEPMAPPPAMAPTTKEIPYDYVATFTLTGRPSNRVQDVINISIEGAFVAVSIGYSFIPALLPELGAIPSEFSDGVIRAGPPPSPTTLLRIIAQTIAVRALEVEDQLQPPDTPPERANLLETVRRLETLIAPFVDPRQFLQCLLVKLCGIDFRYSIIDSGTGRELQNLAIHNIAGLGKADGDRPFRPLAKPMMFMPRSTIRIEVEEISVGSIYSGAQLFIVLHGYKMLGYYGYGTAAP